MTQPSPNCYSQILTTTASIKVLMCTRMPTVWEATCSLPPRYTGKTGRGRDSTPLTSTAKTSTQGRQISPGFQLPLGDLQCHLKRIKIKLIIISLRTRPPSCPFSNCEWCPTEVILALFLSKYQVYLHNLCLIFCSTVITEVQVRISQSHHHWHFRPDNSLLRGLSCALQDCLAAPLVSIH